VAAVLIVPDLSYFKKKQELFTEDYMIILFYSRIIDIGQNLLEFFESVTRIWVL